MRKTTPIFLVIAIVGILVIYGSAAGYPTAIDDFDQPDGTTPADTYVAPIDDHSSLSPDLPTPPVVWRSVNFDFTITNLGWANTASENGLCPSLRMDSFTANQALYISMQEGRIYQNQKLSFWSSPHISVPDIPDVRSWSVHISVYGNVIPFTATWDDTAVHQASGTVVEYNGESGRVLISQPGTYIAEITCLDVENGHMYGASTVTIVIVNFWA
jgi:hypothetical protein